MAVTKILARKGRLDVGINYVLNGDKTQERVLTARLNCDPGRECRQMLDTKRAYSEFLVMLNQAATDRAELARLLNISDNQLSYITNVDFGRGLIKCGSAIVPFMDNFPKNRLYRLMTTKLSETSAA